MADSKSETHWYESLFDERYIGFYEELLDVDVALRDVAFLERAMSLPSGSKLLDLGCGFGRHSVAFARRGHAVTGVDLSEPMLAMARTLAAEYGVAVSWLRRDMRDLGVIGPFDACVCVYTVLGYFDDATNRSVLAGARAAMHRDASLALDVTNPLSMLRSWPGTSWKETSVGVRRESSRYDAMSGCVITERVMFPSRGGRVSLPTSRVRLYAPHEMKEMLRTAGFEVEQVYGAMSDTPFQWNRSLRQVWIARAV